MVASFLPSSALLMVRAAVVFLLPERRQPRAFRRAPEIGPSSVTALLIYPTISLPEKNCAISIAAVCDASEPWTEFSPIEVA
jgi:hypothetical protein